MGGLGFLLTIILYVVIAIFVVRAFKRPRARIIAAVVAILLPTTDAIVGRIYLSHLCKTEGGIVVKKTSHEARGFRIHGGVFAAHDSSEALRVWLNRYGVSFIEGQYKNDGTVDRVSLDNQSVKRERDVQPQSTIELAFKPADLDKLYPRDVDILRDTRTGEVLGSYTMIGFAGGWAERLLARFSDAGPGVVAWCDATRGEERRTELLRRIIAQ